MNFNDMLLKAKIDLSQILVLRHTPPEAKLRRKFDWIANDRPDLFNVYQAVQNKQVEASMHKAKWVASFIGRPEKSAIFVGVYDVKDNPKRITQKQFWANLKNKELRDTFGMMGWQKEREYASYFELEELNSFKYLKGRLIVDWPGREIGWYRWADKNEFAIRCIHEANVLCERRPEPRELVLSWSELKAMPSSWREAISEWRGVYLICDKSDRRMYVGSAYGKENLYKRWTEYAKTGHGGNKYLKARDPENFVFSILQLVPIDVEPREVIQLEANWMNRLHTFYPNGLNSRAQ